MKKLVLLLVLMSVYGILFSQGINGKRVSCVNGIPLECLNTGDTLTGKNVNYEVKKSDVFLFLRNVNNKYDTLCNEGRLLGKNIYGANVHFDSLKNTIFEIVYGHLTHEEIGEVICQNASLYVHSVLDSSLRVREIVFVLPKNICDYDENDKWKFDSIYSRLLSLDYYDKEALDKWKEMYSKRTFDSVESKAYFWRTFPVDRFHEIEKEIVTKARLNEDDDLYQHVIKYDIWKNYFIVDVRACLLDKMRENGGVVPSGSVFYDVFY
ncbi:MULTISPECIES: hypothetical protein [Butyricimonas]|uniref:hypothetical protein n=1 Tax=Butyricimonas TaxID=574697 RepID=UPI0007FB375C|nr:MULTISPECIES: hypothetical protein [Butyricimonas]